MVSTRSMEEVTLRSMRTVATTSMKVIQASTDERGGYRNARSQTSGQQASLAIALHPNQQSYQTCNNSTGARLHSEACFAKNPDDMKAIRFHTRPLQSSQHMRPTCIVFSSM